MADDDIDPRFAFMQKAYGPDTSSIVDRYVIDQYRNQNPRKFYSSETPHLAHDAPIYPPIEPKAELREWNPMPRVQRESAAVVEPVLTQSWAYPLASSITTAGHHVADAYRQPGSPLPDLAKAGMEFATAVAPMAIPGPKGAKGSSLEVRPMSTRALHEIGEANFTTPYLIDPVAHVPLDSLHGGYHRPERVGPLAETIRENKWIEPLVVDREGNVIEGQHRLRALSSLGETTVPVHRLRELASSEQVTAIENAATATKTLHPEQSAQIARQILEIVDKEGVGALKEYSAPPGFEKAWNAAVAKAEEPLQRIARQYEGPQMSVPGKKGLEGFGLRVVKSEGTGIHGETFFDALTPDGKLAARLKIHKDGSVGNVFVDTPFQRENVALKLMKHAAEDLGVPSLGAGSYHTPEGKALRDAYEATIRQYERPEMSVPQRGVESLRLVSGIKGKRLLYVDSSAR